MVRSRCATLLNGIRNLATSCRFLIQTRVSIYSSSCYIVQYYCIVAVDVNPAENALLELKIAAIKHLSYEDYLLVLGDKEDSTNNTIARC